MSKEERIIPIEINKEYSGECCDLTQEGMGIVKINNFTVFVPNLLMGEKATIKITQLQKNFGFGKVVERTVSSKERHKPACSSFGQCGGCELLHLSYSGQTEFKANMVQQTLKRVGGLEEVPYEGIWKCFDYKGYRNKVQIPFGLQNNHFTGGYFERKTHHMISNDRCLLSCLDFNKIFQFVKSMGPTWGIEKTLRHLILRKNSQDEILVCLVLTKPLRNQEVVINDLRQENNNIKGIIENINNSHNNVILGDKTTLLWGNRTLKETLNGLTFEYDILSFFQVNTKSCEALYETIKDFSDVQKGERILDAYCGAGTIGLTITSNDNTLVGIEINPESINNAKINAEMNHLNQVEFYAGDVGTVLKEHHLTAFDIIVVDPPRKGLEKETLDLIKSLKPKKLIYSSCNVATQARDISYLSDIYQVTRVKSVDMFPQTCEIENVCKLELKSI